MTAAIRTRMLVFFSFFLAGLMALFPAPPLLASDDPALTGDERPVLLIPPDGMDFLAWQAELRAAGIVLRHAFPPAGGLAFPDGLPSGVELEAVTPPGTGIFMDPPEGKDAERLQETIEGTFLWRAHRALAGVDSILPPPGLPPGQPLVDDSLTPPIEEREVACDSWSLYRTTSEYMLGAVTVNVILPESTGMGTENWSTTLESQVSTEIVEGLNNLTSYCTVTSSLRPSWTYHYFLGRTDSRARVAVEPISNPHPTDTNPQWVNTIYNALGYSADSTMWDKGRHFNGDQRAADGTDWAFTIFVANSAVDADGLFSDNWSAYGYNGGPHAIMTYDNGAWGYTRMNEVLRHEASHVFYTLDEYAASACTCTETSGYVRYTNTNCQKSCSMNVSCLMRDNSAAVCSSTRGMLGWQDADSDAVPDPVDILPETALPAYFPNPTSNQVLTYTGTATIQTLTNQNVYHYRCDVNILDVAAVQWRVDGGTWANALPVDGAFNSKTESYTFTTPTLAAGPHTIQTRTVDSLGQVDATPAQDNVTVVLIGPPGVPSGRSGTPMRAWKLDPVASMIAMQWDVGTCSPVSHTLLWGQGNQLPTAPGLTYQLSGAHCYFSPTGFFQWNGTPTPTPGPKPLVWWLIVANDGGGIEGSFGTDSFGNERNAGGPGGSSMYCAQTKLTNNPCGP